MKPTVVSSSKGYSFKPEKSLVSKLNMHNSSCVTFVTQGHVTKTFYFEDCGELDRRLMQTLNTPMTELRIQLN